MSLRYFVTRRTLVVIGAALVMAYFSAKFLFGGSIVNVLPWGVLAFATAFLAASERESLALGAIFGFVVSYAFLWFDNSGSKTFANVAILIPLVILPALFGALCGMASAWLGWRVRRLLGKRKT